MLCLGVEHTAHTFSAGVVDDKGNILSMESRTYKPAGGGGIIPADSARFMASIAKETTELALSKAKCSFKEIDLVAFSQGPGLPPTLRAGRDFAVGIAKEHKKPIVGVNHPIGHIEIGRLNTKMQDPVILYVSGGNSQVIAFAAGRYRVFGETLDIAIGNALDKFAREVGLGFPGGPKVEKQALGGKYIELPYTVKGMDFAFSGLITSALRLWKGNKASLHDLCFSIQETAFAELIEVTERALAHTGKSEVMITGGVAANRRFCEMLDTMCKERGAISGAVKIEYSQDNGAMIAWAGILQWLITKKETKDFEIKPRWRVDEVEVTWLKQ